MSLIDTHCHLDFPDFSAELPEVVARANAAGVQNMITISTHTSKIAQVRAVATQFPSVYYTVGVHPHHAGEPAEQISKADLLALAQQPKVVGIGETGLDYYYNHSAVEAQKTSFIKHMEVCLELDLPIIIHSRDADEDMAQMLKDVGGGKLRGVLHCFSSGRGLAEAGLALGFYISFSGILTFKKSEELRAIARDVPFERLLVETDAPYLAPVPLRGKTNEPAYVAHTAAVLADVKAISPEKLATITTTNAKRLFNRLPQE